MKQCERHKKYKGELPPRAQCETCQVIWADLHRDSYPTCSDAEWVLLKMHQPLSQQQIELLRRTKVDLLTTTVPGKPRRWLTLYKQLDRASMPASKLADISISEIKDNATIKNLRKENKALIQRIESLEELTEELTMAAMIARAPLEVHKRVLKNGEVEPEAMPLVFLGDWHAGKQIEFKKVLMRNEFNPDIFQARVRRLADSIVSMVRHYREMRPINKLGLISLGDLMENELRTESAATNTLMPFDEKYLVQSVLDWMIDYVQTHTGCHVYVHFEWGNHTRSTQKIEWGRIKEMSYEYSLALEIAARYASNDKVSVDWSEGDQSILPIFGDTIRTTHGFGIQYRKNAGGISASAYTMVRGWNTGLRDPPLLTVGAHFHHKTAPLGLYFINCLCGYDSFAQGKGFPFSDPSQSMLLWDSKRGPTMDCNLFLTD